MIACSRQSLVVVFALQQLRASDKGKQLYKMYTVSQRESTVSEQDLLRDARTCTRDVSGCTAADVVPLSAASAGGLMCVTPSIMQYTGFTLLEERHAAFYDAKDQLVPCVCTLTLSFCPVPATAGLRWFFCGMISRRITPRQCRRCCTLQRSAHVRLSRTCVTLRTSASKQ